MGRRGFEKRAQSAPHGRSTHECPGSRPARPSATPAARAAHCPIGMSPWSCCQPAGSRARPGIQPPLGEGPRGPAARHRTPPRAPPAPGSKPPPTRGRRALRFRTSQSFLRRASHPQACAVRPRCCAWRHSCAWSRRPRPLAALRARRAGALGTAPARSWPRCAAPFPAVPMPVAPARPAPPTAPGGAVRPPLGVSSGLRPRRAAPGDPAAADHVGPSAGSTLSNRHGAPPRPPPRPPDDFSRPSRRVAPAHTRPTRPAHPQAAPTRARRCRRCRCAGCARRRPPPRLSH
jgi:hypothetical protein